MKTMRMELIKAFKSHAIPIPPQAKKDEPQVKTVHEYCAACGCSVKRGIGEFVNRVPRDMQAKVNPPRRYPQGGFICARCANIPSEVSK